MTPAIARSQPMPQKPASAIVITCRRPSCMQRQRIDPCLAARCSFVIVRLDRRELVWISVTTRPSAEWVARQITEAFPWNKAPRYMIRDRDRIYGPVVTRRLRAMGIRDKLIAPASPWQNGFAERLIGSIRRECLDHVIVLGELHLRRILKSYADYYNGVRTHRS